jgi:signal transduction histidine kinase
MARTQALTPETLLPRLGEYLVQRGHITEADLKKALVYQQKKQSASRRMHMGETLLELKLIDRRTLDQAITEQIIQLRNALEDSNRFLERRVQERTAELQLALRKLSEINQLKANFVANISHELRTPLTHVKGYVELFATESLGPLDAEQKKAIQVMQQATTRLQSLIDNLILFSQASRGELTLHLTQINLNKIAIDILNYSHQKAIDRNITLSADIKPNLPPVKADEQKITWALIHLMDNAIKFTNPGGKVGLLIKRDADTLVRVSVADTGIGIPKKRLHEMFEPFHQLDGSSTRRYGGTGIGLALVRQILDAHGSIIDVQSEEGKGTVVSFTLLIAGKPA